MNFIVDAQLPPALAQHLSERFAVAASHVRDLGLRDAADLTIHEVAKRSASVVVTKDSDFVELVHRHGVPPQVVWVTCGNTTNNNLKRIFDATFAIALQLLVAGESVVEIADAT